MDGVGDEVERDDCKPQPEAHARPRQPIRAPAAQKERKEHADEQADERAQPGPDDQPPRDAPPGKLVPDDADDAPFVLGQIAARERQEQKGKQKVGDREAYVIVATPAAGSPEKWYFDTQTGLLIRTDSERESPEGKVPVEAYLEDYKEIDGVKLPFTLRQVLPAFSIIIKISEVKHNVPIEDSKFDKPSGQ